MRMQKLICVDVVCRLRTRRKKPGMCTQCRGGLRTASITRCTSTTHFCRTKTHVRRSVRMSWRRRGRRTSSRRPSRMDLDRSKICPPMKSFRPVSKCVYNYEFLSPFWHVFFAVRHSYWKGKAVAEEVVLDVCHWQVDFDGRREEHLFSQPEITKTSCNFFILLRSGFLIIFFVF